MRPARRQMTVAVHHPRPSVKVSPQSVWCAADSTSNWAKRGRAVSRIPADLRSPLQDRR